MENWKDVKGYEGGYQVSDLGNVRSLDRIDSIGRKMQGKMLGQSPEGRGYLKVSLYLNGKQSTKKVHQLVAGAFLNHTPCGMQVVIDHVDNNPLNNILENLQLISQRENTSKDKTGGTSKYIGVHFYKITNKYVARCRLNGKAVHLGYFNTEREASQAYNNFLNSIR